MGNRSKYVAAKAVVAAAAAVTARRRARLRRAMEAVRETILPSHVPEFPTDAPVRSADEAHAPGHQHLTAAADHVLPRRGRDRDRSRFAPGMRQRIPDR